MQPQRSALQRTDTSVGAASGTFYVLENAPEDPNVPWWMRNLPADVISTYLEMERQRAAMVAAIKAADVWCMGSDGIGLPLLLVGGPQGAIVDALLEASDEHSLGEHLDWGDADSDEFDFDNDSNDRRLTKADRDAEKSDDEFMREAEQWFTEMTCSEQRESLVRVTLDQYHKASNRPRVAEGAAAMHQLAAYLKTKGFRVDVVSAPRGM
jgi:hypothetical protein